VRGFGYFVPALALLAAGLFVLATQPLVTHTSCECPGPGPCSCPAISSQFNWLGPILLGLALFCAIGGDLARRLMRSRARASKLLS
jgi:hypothetical protein